MMANEARSVLAQLVRSGLWSRPGQLFAHRRLVLDADSVVTYLYRYCLRNHLKRQKQLAPKRGHRSKGPSSLEPLDYRAGTLVNYREFSLYVNNMLDLFEAHSIELHVVYRGKSMEAPLCGLLPAQVKKNTQRVSERIQVLAEASEQRANGQDKGSRRAQANSNGEASSSSGPRIEMHLSQARPSRPNLALNIFKSIINARMKRRAPKPPPAAASLKAHQAFYSPYPAMAKLARDLRCPVMTNDGEFVLLDVRAGFVLFEEFFAAHLAPCEMVGRRPSASSVSSMASSFSATLSPSASNSSKAVHCTPESAPAPVALPCRPAQARGAPLSPASGGPLSDAKSLFQRSSSDNLRVHFNSTFLRQHPGLNAPLAMQLFPLTATEFLTEHAKSLTRMRILDRDLITKDLVSAPADLMNEPAQSINKKYHSAAARLEMVCRYLCTKDLELFKSLIKGEAHRLAESSSTFHEDYRELFNYYAVAYDFRERLKFVLGAERQSARSADSHADGRLTGHELQYIEDCLASRECTADYLLPLLVCSLGCRAALAFNKSMQFEDPRTLRSAYSMLDSGKCALMSLLSGNRSGPSLNSSALSKKQSRMLAAASGRYASASLTVLDRVEARLGERTLKTSLPQPIALPITLAQLANESGNDTSNCRSHAANFVARIFKKRDASQLTKLEPQKLAERVADWGSLANHNKQDRQQLAILLHLHRYSLETAAIGDAYFKQHYLSLAAHFETALVSHAIYLNYINSNNSQLKTANGPDRSGVSRSIERLVDLVNMYDLENLANLNFGQERMPTSQLSGGVAQKFRLAGRDVKHSSTVDRYSKRSPSTMNHTRVAKATAREVTQSADDQPPLSRIERREISKRIRHLIELLSASLEGYCELNSLFNYPLPSLNLAKCYNPVLIFNLALYDREHPNNTKLIKY